METDRCSAPTQAARHCCVVIRHWGPFTCACLLCQLPLSLLSMESSSTSCSLSATVIHRLLLCCAKRRCSFLGSDVKTATNSVRHRNIRLCATHQPQPSTHTQHTHRHLAIREVTQREIEFCVVIW